MYRPKAEKKVKTVYDIREENMKARMVSNPSLNLWGEIDSQNVYYNVTLAANTIPNTNIIDDSIQSNTLAAYKDNLGGLPLVMHAQDYKCTIFRFDVSAATIPLRNMTLLNPTSDFSTLNESVTLTYGGFQVQTYLIWVPQNLTIPIPTNSSQLISTNYYFMYNYRHYCSLINTAFLTAFNALALLVALPTTNPPQIMYDFAYNTFTMVVDETYANETTSLTPLVPGVQVWFNYALMARFFLFKNDYVNVISPTGMNNLLKFANYGTNVYDQTGGNPVLYYSVYSNPPAKIDAVLLTFELEYSISASMVDFSHIVFTSTLPTRKES